MNLVCIVIRACWENLFTREAAVLCPLPIFRCWLMKGSVVTRFQRNR